MTEGVDVNDAPIRDSDLTPGAAPTGVLHADYVASIVVSNRNRRVPAVAAALGIDEDQATALVIALLE